MGRAGRRSTVGAIAGGLTGLVSGYVQQQLMLDRLAEERRRYEEDRQFRREIADRDYQGQLRRERTQERQFGQQLGLQREQLQANVASQREATRLAQRTFSHGVEMDNLKLMLGQQNRREDIAREDRRFGISQRFAERGFARNKEVEDRDFALRMLSEHLQSQARQQGFELDVNKALLDVQSDATRSASSIVGQILRMQEQGIGGEPMPPEQVIQLVSSLRQQLTPDIVRNLGGGRGGAGGGLGGDVMRELRGVLGVEDPAAAPAPAPAPTQGQGAAAPIVPGPQSPAPTRQAGAQPRAVASPQELAAIGEELFQISKQFQAKPMGPFGNKALVDKYREVAELIARGRPGAALETLEALAYKEDWQTGGRVKQLYERLKAAMGL